MTGKLQDQVAIITGGASGIGEAIALLFAEEGAHIAVADLNEERGAKVVTAIKSLERDAIFVRTDTSSEEQCEALASATVEHFGSVSIQVGAAGISNAQYTSENPTSALLTDPEGSFLVSAGLDAWQRVIDVNLTGVMLSARAAARRMIESGSGGNIINLASIMAKVPRAGVAPYCVSKAGVWMLTQCLSLELAAHNIRVNAIGPGFIETPMTAPMRTFESGSDWAMDLTTMGRFGTAQEVAKTALFLASEDSSFYTGNILHPDGGVFTG